MPQVVRQAQGAGIASLRFLLQAFQADRFQVPRHGRLQAPGRDRFLGTNQQQGIERGRPLEWHTAGEQFVQNHPQAVDVGRGPNLLNLATRLLGRHIGGRTNDIAFVSRSGVHAQPLGDAEIGNLGKSRSQIEDCRLEIRAARLSFCL